MNAARPIMGTKSFANGPFLAGRFYAAIDPTDERAASYVETNRTLDAHVVVKLTQEEQVDLILWQDEYEDAYREQFHGDELFNVLGGRVSELNSLTFGELQARRRASYAAATKQALPSSDASLQPEHADAIAHMVLIAADSIEQLRRPDVYRVLDQADSQEMLRAIASYIVENRPDLAEEISGSLSDIAQERGYEAVESVINELSDDSLIALQQEVKRLFSEGAHQDVYTLFKQDPTANDLPFDEFVSAMHASAGGPEAALRLTAAQRSNLSMAGASAAAIELFARESDLRQVFAMDSDAARELVQALVQRERSINEALVMVGWATGKSSDEAGGERSTFWTQGQHQLYMMMTEKGWQFSGHVNGAVLPAFAITDDFGTPQDQLLASIAKESESFFATDQQPEQVEKEQSAQAILPEDAEEDEAPVIDRVWRGATYEEILAGQKSNAWNVEAFTALAKAEKDGIGPDDWRLREALASFKGWGGIAGDVRTDARVKSKNRNGELIASRLGMESGAYNRLMLANRLESYYTPAPLSRGIWLLLQQAGIPADGRYLEPGCGTGIFYATAPAEVQQHARMVGVECDPIATRIAKVMVPDVTLVDQRYERAVLDRNFDAVIGNVPFGETIITDSRYPKASHIHDYFIVRSLDHLKPGGMMAVITSSGTMDKKDHSVRQQIMERANLVAGLRLPVEAFGDQGASVTTDILILQKRPKGTAPDYDITKTANMAVDGDDSQTFPVNQYFLDNPENVLGTYKVESSAFGPKLTVRAAEEITANWRGYAVLERLAESMLARGKAIVPEGIANRSEWPVAALSDDQNAAPAQNELPDTAVMMDEFTGFVGDMVVLDDKIVEVVDIVDQFDDNGIRIGRKYLATGIEVSDRNQELLKAYIHLRDSARALINQQLEGDDEELAAAQNSAKAAYEAFVERFGPVNAPANVKVFGDDPGSAEVCALEVWDDDAEKVEALADAFTKRVVNPAIVATAGNADDAYFVSIDRKGIPDLEFMEQISGIAQEQLLKELLGVRVFFDPASGSLVRADHYLSGNVVRKLEDARQAALLNEQYQRNVDALVAIQPTRIPFQDITINLGASWIPADDIRLFVGSLLAANLTESDFKVRYSKDGAFWSIDVSSAFKRDYDTQRTTLYGTSRASLEVLLEKLLNKQKPTHTYKDDQGKTKTDEQATLASRAKQDELNELFYRWVASEPDRAERYASMYNESTNVIRLPEVDGSRLSFPGLAPTWQPRDHQKDMVAMAMLGYNVMAAHAVGAGKTFEMVAIAMKLKQIGMVNKPMIAVPNHMLGQISREAKQMYPGARILMVTADDLRGNQRQRFLGIARNNDWDIVVCTHSMLNGISAPLDIVIDEYEQQINVLQSKLAEADNSRLERQLSAKIKSIESTLAAARDQFIADEEKGNLLTLDKFGVDALQVDEAHLYKNLDLASSMNVLGVTTAGSKRSFNMWALGRYLEKLHGRPFGLNFFTGTPIANSMCELYVHNKMLRNDLLLELGIHHFDEWASRFGDVVSNLEALPEGGGFRVNERFARFVNCPEMLKLFRSFADVKTKDQMKLPRPKVHSKVVSVDQSEWQEAFMKHLAIRAVAVRKGMVDPSDDNMLSIASAGRKAALDMRLVEPSLPEQSSLKLQAVAENIHRLWEQHADVKATQLVFIDLGTPGKDKEFSTYTELKELLVGMGMPAGDIAFIHDAKNNDAKEELFEKVRSGDKRVLVGSTEKMGVGTNVQERLCALHNVDCPWRPADIEQRNGRIDRQGNLFFSEVEEYRYTTKDSFDLFMWETNKRKATFIAQALSDPDIAGRDVSEEMDLGYAEVMAVTTGNPRIREKVEVDDKLVKLERKDKAWYGDRAAKLSAEYYLKQDIKSLEDRIEAERAIGGMLPRTPWKCVEVSGAISGVQDADTTWLYATDLGNALLARVATVEARMMLNNRSDAPLNARVGDIELMLEIKLVGELKGMWFIYGQSSKDGKRLAGNTVQQTKNTQMLGRGVRGWFDCAKRLQELSNDMMIKKRGLLALGDLTALREATSPYQAELDQLKETKRELDAWFAAQDFDKLGDGPDPFLLMLAEHRMARLTPAADELEAVEIVDSGLMATVQEGLFDQCETEEMLQSQQPQKRGRTLAM